MIFKIYDGRTEFYQWDLDRKIIVSDPTIDEVHFCNKTGDCALVVEVYEEEGLRLANVPNIALQSDLPIYVYGYCGGSYTKNCASFKVRTRNRPADYIYTETIVKEVFTQTLEGNEEDKAPSVKAVNEALAGKLDAKDQPDAGKSYVYAVNYDNTQTLFKTSMHGSPGDVVMYGATSNTGKSKPSGTIGVNMPEQPYQAAPKQYVDDGLEGRVPAVNSSWKFYGTGSVDPTTGKAVQRTVAGAGVGVGDGIVVLFKTKTAADFDLYEDATTSTIGVCDPIKPIQAANKRYVDEAVEGRVPVYTDYPSKLYGTGGSAGAATQRVYSMSPVGWTTGDVVSWRKVDADSFDYNTPVVCTIGVCDPIKPIQVANKRYVDGKVSELEQGIHSALGTQYTFESCTPSGPFIYIPAGALPAAYIEKVGKASAFSQGESKGDFDIQSIKVLDENRVILHYYAPTPDTYITLPENAAIIEFESGANNFESVIVDASIKFQVRVGG